MKRSIQLVALVIVALLAIQPALADVLCLTQDGPQPMEAHGCCAGSDMASVHQHTASSRPNAQMQSDCNQGCCSVSQQNAPAPFSNDKGQADRAPVVQATVAVLPVPVSAPRPCQSISHHPPAAARYLLLQVFRI